MTEVTEQDVVETRRLATFRIVDAIEPIEGADAIELAVLGGWKVVTKKGEFKPGDPCVYFEIDSFLRDGVPAWQFLVDKQPKIFNGVKGHKLRTGKFRGQISQGLVLKISEFPVLELVLKPGKLHPNDSVIVEALPDDVRAELWVARHALSEENEAALSPEDLNLNTLLGVVKWEPPPMNAQLQGMAEGLFPSFIRKTDQERAQNLVNEIFGFEDQVIPANPELNRPEIRRAAKGDRNAKYEVTMKLDGSSMTTFARVVEKQFGMEPKVGGQMAWAELVVESGVCSRNLQLKVSEANAENSFVKMAVESGLLGVLTKLAEEEGLQLAVQGELMGPGIQENREQLKANELYMFDIFDIKAGEYLAPVARREMFDRLVALGAKIKHVPVIAYTANLYDTLGITDMPVLLRFAEGPSIKHPVREGLVYKRLDGKFSFKTISNKYLEKQKD